VSELPDEVDLGLGLGADPPAPRPPLRRRRPSRSTAGSHDLPCGGEVAVVQWRKRRWRCRAEDCLQQTFTEQGRRVDHVADAPTTSWSAGSGADRLRHIRTRARPPGPRTAVSIDEPRLPTLRLPSAGVRQLSPSQPTRTRDRGDAHSAGGLGAATMWPAWRSPRWLTNQSRASPAACSSVPGSSNRCVARPTTAS
jgi:hypothetical protein